MSIDVIPARVTGAAVAALRGRHPERGALECISDATAVLASVIGPIEALVREQVAKEVTAR